MIGMPLIKIMKGMEKISIKIKVPKILFMGSAITQPMSAASTLNLNSKIQKNWNTNFIVLIILRSSQRLGGTNTLISVGWIMEIVLMGAAAISHASGQPVGQNLTS